jgi:hypothetical protein
VDKREAYGWFGIPWPSGICYHDDGNLTNEMHKAFPIGESCIFCGEVFDELAGDSGKAIPSPEGVGHTHKECLLLSILGPFLRDPDYPDMTLRQAALELWSQLTKSYE